MEDDKTSWSNVVIGPWDTKPTKGGKTRDALIEEEMDVIEDIAQKCMFELIKVLKENDAKITTKDFYRHIGFMNETLKAFLFSELGYDHPLSDFVNYIIIPMKSKSEGDIYTKFRSDLIAELVEYLEEDIDEE